MNYAISNANIADATALYKLESDCFSAIDIFSKRQFLRLLKSPTCKILVIRGADGSILAEIIGLLRHFSIPSGRIYKLAVHPTIRGNGLGRKLIAAMESEFEKAGMCRVVAEVRVSNTPSAALFRACGYQVVGMLPNYYADGEDGIKFSKILAQSNDNTAIFNKISDTEITTPFP